MRAIVPIFSVIVLAIVPALRAQEAKTPVPPTAPAAQPAVVVPSPPKVSSAKAETKDGKAEEFYLKALKPETVVLVFKSVSIVPKPGSKDDR